MKSLTQQEVALHVTILGWVHIATSLFFLLVGAFLFFFLPSVGLVSRDADAIAILSLVGTFVGSFIALLGLPGILAGIGLLLRRAWGRYLAIVVGLLGLINFPIGTLIGAYTLYVLMQSSANDYFGTTVSA